MGIVGRLKDIYWGWFVVVGTFWVLSASYGARYCFGVFVHPMFVDRQWPMSSISLAFSISLIMYGLGGLVSGRLLDRMAPRWIMTIGACIVAIGFVATGFVQTPFQLYITFGVLCGMGSAGIGAVVGSASVGKWFIRRRGVAIGVASIGIGAGTMLLTPVAGWIVKNYHWRSGFIFLGFFVLVMGVLVSQLLMRKSRPEEYGLLPDGDRSEIRTLEGESAVCTPPRKPSTNVLRDHRFWVIVICFTGAVMAQMMVFVHQVAYAVDNGIGRIAAASSLGAIGIASIFGRFFFGWLSDHIHDPKYSALLGYIIMTCGMVLLLNVRTIGVLYVYALVLGFGYGSLAPMMPILVSDRFGRDVLGSAYGLLTFFTSVIGGTLGPVLGGIIYDTSGSYTYAWSLNIAVLIFISFCLLGLKPKATTPDRNAGKIGEKQ
jgi:sugar phosphate permease